MLSIKSLAISGVICFVVGFYLGYSYCSDKNEIERLNTIRATLENENSALMKQVEIEHEWQEKSKQIAEQAQDSLASLQHRYDDALASLDSLQQLDTDNSNSTALSAGSTSTRTDTESTANKCNCKNTASFRRLYEESLKIAKECETQETYLKQCRDLYNAIQNPQ